MSAPEIKLPAGAVAVIGMACRFPGANSPHQFWQNLRRGAESIHFFSASELESAGIDGRQRGIADYVAAKGLVDEADGFDAAFFGFSAREAELMDPQQRVFLECAWSAIEDAGYNPRQCPGAVGVFAGSILSTYLLRNVWANQEIVEGAGNFQMAVGNDPTFLASRVSYELDLRGPSVSVGTACSTSLVAVHMACQSLLSLESDMALAGGVSIHLPLIQGYRYQDGGILSPDGHCRPFDAAAQGTVSSDGAGVVVLKRLADAVTDGDFVYAVIRGSAMNNDGSAKVGYTAPSVSGQAHAITEALAVAGVEPWTLAMIEAHGAGTSLGDPIEVAALLEAFGPCNGKGKFCALGSVKSNIGHVDAAAGIAGFIKTALALQHGEVPPTLHFTKPNPRIHFDETPFYVNSELKPMPRGETPLRGGVSSFGIGGTNVHVVLEEASCLGDHAECKRQASPYDLVVLSARTPAALEAATDQLAEFLERTNDSDFADVCFTLRSSRSAFEYRRALVCSGREETIKALRQRDPQVVYTGTASSAKPLVAFMFPGLGDHYSGMGWELYCAEPEFRNSIDRCSELLKPHLDSDIRDFLYGGRNWEKPGIDKVANEAASARSGLDFGAMLGSFKTGQVKEQADWPAAAQPAIFATEIALANLLQSWGIQPDAMIGHSIGEFAAAHLSGVLSLPDVLELVAARARLIQSRVEPGAMLAVPLCRTELEPLLPPGVSLGAVNAARLSVASGEKAGIATLEALLIERGVNCQRLRSTHAYHSHVMSSIAEPLAAVVRRFRLRPPRIPYISCISGTWITAEQATDPNYWGQHLCRTVNFQQGLSELLSEPRRILLEVGPGQGLTSHAVRERARIPERQNPVIATMRWFYDRQSELAALFRSIGFLWLGGTALPPSALRRERQRRIPLPTYPFQRQRYWIAPRTKSDFIAPPAASLKNSDVAEWFYLPSWKPSLRGPRRNVANSSWLIFADKFGAGEQLAEEIRALGGHISMVQMGDAFRSTHDGFIINPGRSEDYDKLVSHLKESSRIPTTVVHMWSLTGDDASPPSILRFRQIQETGYYSLMYLLQALRKRIPEGSFQIEIVANHLYQVNGMETVTPEKATLRAPAMVAPQEHAQTFCRIIDTDLAPDEWGQREAFVHQLLNEISSNPGNPAVAYRHGQRFIQAYERARMEVPDEQKIPFRRHGVYLITGGLGGVGLVLARRLAEFQAKLVLIGRSEFPDRTRWTHWLDEHNVEDGVSLKIRQLQALEEMGAELLVLRADVADVEAMISVLKRIETTFGALNGVIHAAGSVGIQAFREIRQTTTTDSEAQFTAKVYGLLALEQVLAGRCLDFVLLTSSLSAILGGLGFASYSACNAFMDAFAHWKHRAGGTFWTSVDWDSWRLSDVQSVIAGLGATVNDFVMEPEEGVSACERILSEGNLSQVVVSTGDLHVRLRQWIERGGQPSCRDAGLQPLHERPSFLQTQYEAPRGKLENQLAEIWQELFGLEKIGVNDNFFELGGHSLLATQLNARLHSKLHVEMSLAELLQSPTIERLAIAIVNSQVEQSDEARIEAALSELSQLSEDEVQRLLAADVSSSDQD